VPLTCTITVRKDLYIHVNLGNGVACVDHLHARCPLAQLSTSGRSLDGWAPC
jgi:hypothetical protein